MIQSESEHITAKNTEESSGCGWPDNYFAEAAPEKRKQILDQAMAENAEMAEQIGRLFERRYKKDKNGKYADTFLREFLQLKMTAENLDSMFAEKKNKKAAVRALHQMCLDEASEFPEEILYREMCQLAAWYIRICAGDKNYTAILWGLGKKSDAKITEKIALDLDRIGEAIPKYLDMEEEFRILKRAILDMKEKYL